MTESCNKRNTNLIIINQSIIYLFLVSTWLANFTYLTRFFSCQKKPLGEGWLHSNNISTHLSNRYWLSKKGKKSCVCKSKKPINIKCSNNSKTSSKYHGPICHNDSHIWTTSGKDDNEINDNIKAWNHRNNS